MLIIPAISLQQRVRLVMQTFRKIWQHLEFGDKVAKEI